MPCGGGNQSVLLYFNHFGLSRLKYGGNFRPVVPVALQGRSRLWFQDTPARVLRAQAEEVSGGQKELQRRAECSANHVILELTLRAPSGLGTANVCTRHRR